MLGISENVQDFPNAPPHPPNQTQIVERSKEGHFDTKMLLKEFRQLILQPGFVMHTLAYGLNTGGFSAICTLLNQYVIDYFPVRKFLRSPMSKTLFGYF